MFLRFKDIKNSHVNNYIGICFLTNKLKPKNNFIDKTDSRSLTK